MRIAISIMGVALVANYDILWCTTTTIYTVVVDAFSTLHAIRNNVSTCTARFIYMQTLCKDLVLRPFYTCRTTERVCSMFHACRPIKTIIKLGLHVYGL